MKQCIANNLVIPEAWKSTFRGRTLHGRGNAALLSRPLTAFFASRVCPATAARAGLTWALEQVHAGAAVIGGFHSPLERSVLHLLLEARNPAVAVLARDVESARLAAPWQAAIQNGHLAVVSQVIGRHRLDRGRSNDRNELVAALAFDIVVAHAAEAGSLAAQIAEWRRCGKAIRVLHGECVVHAARHDAVPAH